jgi:hypothetical protein
LTSDCHSVIKKQEKWKYINLNPSAPTIRGLLKIHKNNSPVRPVINWRKARAYKLAKLLSKQLQTHILMPYIFNVKNSVKLINDLLEIPFNKDLQFVSFDITNMYSIVPIDEVIKIIDSICKTQDVVDHLGHE